MPQQVKNLPAMQETQETQVQTLGQGESLGKEMATHSSILAWKIPWTEEPGGLQSKGLRRVDTAEQLHIHTNPSYLFSLQSSTRSTRFNSWLMSLSSTQLQISFSHFKIQIDDLSKSVAT